MTILGRVSASKQTFSLEGMRLTLYFLALCACTVLFAIWGVIPYSPSVHRQRPTVYSRLFLLTLSLASTVQAMRMYPFGGTVERLMVEGMIADVVVILAALAGLFTLVGKGANRCSQTALAAREKWVLALLVPTLLAGLAVFEFLITRVLRLHT